MEHEDFEQQMVTFDNDVIVAVTFCTCGKAFWAYGTDAAYAMWEQHEADY